MAKKQTNMSFQSYRTKTRKERNKTIFWSEKIVVSQKNSVIISVESSRVLVNIGSNSSFLGLFLKHKVRQGTEASYKLILYKKKTKKRRICVYIYFHKYIVSGQKHPEFKL